MKKLSLAAIALSAIATSLVSTPSATASGTDPNGPGGRRCGYAATTDPNPEADANDMTGEISAGPATTSGGTMICTIQVDSNTHAGPDAASREFASDANGVVAGVQTVTYSTAEDAQDFLCTSFRKTDGPTIYWTPDANGGHWHTTPDVPCSAATQIGTDDVWDIIDGTLCPELAEHHVHGDPTGSTYVDHEGDVFVDHEGDGIKEDMADSSDAMTDLFWDCPVYTFTINNNSNPDAVHDAHNNAVVAGQKVIDE